jgi:hypothetical protein
MLTGSYHLASARFDAEAQTQLSRFLEYLGSRLVFIIDWNTARKRLRRLVGRRTAIELLRWGAEHGPRAYRVPTRGGGRVRLRPARITRASHSPG